MRIQKLLVAAALVVAPMALAVGTASAAPASAPTFTISPNPAGPGDHVILSGTGCVREAGDPEDFQPQVEIRLVDAELPVGDGAGAKKIAAGDDDDNLLAVLIANPDGTWALPSLDLPPEVPSFEFTFAATCDLYDNSFPYKSATLTINGNLDEAGMFLPDFLATKPTLNAGKSYDVDAYGFEPGETVDMFIHSTPVQIATYVADEDGFIDTEKFTVPLNTLGGDHTLELVGEDSGVTTTLPVEVIAASVISTTTVTATVPTTVTPTATATRTTTTASATTTAAPVLASTGTSAAPQMTAVGLLLTLGGVGTLLFARRRGSRSH